MNPWLEAFGAAALAVLGVFLGRLFSQLPGKRWLWGYSAALLLALFVGIGRRFYSLLSIPPFSLLLAGRAPFALSGFIIALLLSVLLYQCPKRRERLILWCLLTIAITDLSLSVFIGPALSRPLLLSLRTSIDSDGVCRQNTDYTCGPAASVTALRILGIHGEEGELAILAHTSSMAGTPPDILAHALQQRYGGDGVTAKLVSFQSLEELNQEGVTIALVRFGFLVDHYVVVLSVDNKKVVVADPDSGRNELTREVFEKQWKFAGVRLTRSSSASVPLCPLPAPAF